MYGMFEANFVLIVVISDRESAGCDRDRSAQPIGALIRDVRRRRHMTQYALAAELIVASGNSAMTPSCIARWERGRRIPGPYWRGWLGVVLGVSDDQLAEAARLARARRHRPHGPANDRRRPPR